MIEMTANFIGHSSYTGMTISGSNVFGRNVKFWEDNSITVFSWTFSIAIRISFVVGDGIRVGGYALFKCSYVFLSKVDVHEGGNGSLFCC